MATDSKKQEALYGLRNALAHQYCTAWVSSRTTIRSHLFEYHFDPSSQTLLQLRDPEWDGNVAHTAPATVVNLAAVEELGESIVETIQKDAQDGYLASPLTQQELDRRFHIRLIPVKHENVPLTSPPLSGAPIP